MKSLLLRLEGPLQSWGYRSRFTNRDTGLEPTKSGVTGLLCCALGRPRTESPADLAALTMHVRVDRQGTILRDFHTAGGGVFRGSRQYYPPTSSGSSSKNPAITQRYYLQDAAFLVALEGDPSLLRTLADALADPVWPLTLGRRSCPPATPVLVGPRDADAEAALENEPLTLPPRLAPRVWDDASGGYVSDTMAVQIRLVLECEPHNARSVMRRDVPLQWPNQLVRDYGVRFVRERWIPKTPEAAP